METWQHVFVLHRWHYSETSLLVDLFSEQHGRIKVIAKGARARRSSLKGILQPFTPLLMRWQGRGEVKTLHAAEAAALALPLSGQPLYCALYVNELLARLLDYDTACHRLFAAYLSCITTLAVVKESTEPALRSFEFALLQHLGYGVDFMHCASSGELISDAGIYRWQEQQGFSATLGIDEFSFTGRQLRAFNERDFSAPQTRQAAKRLSRLMFKPLLNGKPLTSQQLFRQHPQVKTSQ